jgi:hypothetical protein
VSWQHTPVHNIDAADWLALVITAPFDDALLISWAGLSAPSRCAIRRQPMPDSAGRRIEVFDVRPRLVVRTLDQHVLGHGSPYVLEGQPRRTRPSPARRRRATMWCARPGCSAARSASGARSSSTRTVRSCRATARADFRRYDPATNPAEVRAINQKLRKAIEAEGRRGLVEGLWWQLSLTMRSEGEPSAVGLLRILRDRDGGLNVTGRAWQEDGTLSARYWSEAAKERRLRPASSTSGRASALGTRMPRSSRAPARSGWRPQARATRLPPHQPPAARTKLEFGARSSSTPERTEAPVMAN